jgi:hypothetical protein
MDARREKREYTAPSIEDLGQVHELTLEGGKKPVGLIDGPHGPKTGQGSARLG